MIGLDTRLRFKSPGEIIRGYLAGAPLPHAMFRIAEIMPFCSFALRRPVLDLGCGGGDFARFAVDGGIDVGVDSCRAQLKRAGQGKRYGRLLEADARRMPLADREMATVISISALEHMPDPLQVVREVGRVLMPGGRFLGTAVLRELQDQLFYPSLFRRVGLGLLARWYQAAQAKVFRHVTLLSREEWEWTLTASGFRILASRRVVSPALLRWWDCLLPSALPYKLLGRRVLPLGAPPRWLAGRIGAWLSADTARAEANGGVLMFVAEKCHETRYAQHDRRPRKRSQAMACLC